MKRLAAALVAVLALLPAAVHACTPSGGAGGYLTLFATMSAIVAAFALAVLVAKLLLYRVLLGRAAFGKVALAQGLMIPLVALAATVLTALPRADLAPQKSTWLMILCMVGTVVGIFELGTRIERRGFLQDDQTVQRWTKPVLAVANAVAALLMLGGIFFLSKAVQC